MRRLLLLFAFSLAVAAVWAQDFDTYFENRTMRIDVTHSGNATGKAYYYNRTVAEPYWAGSRTNLIDRFNYGNHRLVLTDRASGEVIYTIGYCSLFNEWQHTEEAERISKSFPESVVFPYPKADAILELFTVNGRTGEPDKVFEHHIDPNSYQIITQKPKGESFDVEINGSVESCVDLVLLSEGYASGQKEQFVQDCRFFVESLFAYEPFKSRRNKFNVRAVWCGDGFDDGVSVPGEHIWKNTPLSSSFYTFDSERYLMIYDFQTVRDYAATVPYDYIYVISNTEKYGGGGIYNFYAISSARHSSTKMIYVHEFGHLLMGLGDEYVGGADEMYDLSVEPWEPNLTTLVNFDSKAWRRMIEADTPIPTPAIIENRNVVGVYEGGGYVSKGVYRPWINCMMNNLHIAAGFCPVCIAAMEEYIDFITSGNVE